MTTITQNDAVTSGMELTALDADFTAWVVASAGRLTGLRRDELKRAARLDADQTVCVWRPYMAALAAKLGVDFSVGQEEHNGHAIFYFRPVASFDHFRE